MILQKSLFKSVPNSPLILFRIIWGALMCAEAIGAMTTGWVDDVFISQNFLFTFFGFEFLQIFLTEWMYVYFYIMAILGAFICIGFKYRLSSLLYAILWTLVYLSHKIHYNNHHYLIVLISWIMVFVPAEKDLSIDANSKGRSREMPNWVRVVFIGQLLIVYTYGSIAKIYPDWLSGQALGAIFSYKSNHPLFGDYVHIKALHYFFSYAGLIFDLVIIPLLIWKRTRFLMFIASLFFHLSNVVIFEIGVFPFLALALDVVFLNPKFIDKYLFRRATISLTSDYHTINKPIIGLVVLYLCVQTILPLRHWFIPGDVLCTEEGHRLSWRMMLRSKSGRLKYIVKDKNGKFLKRISPIKYFSKDQSATMCTRPDMIYAGAQELNRIYSDEIGEDSLQIYALSSVKINKNKQNYRLIDPDVDLTKVKWNTFGHNEWIICACKNCEQ